MGDSQYGKIRSGDRSNQLSHEQGSFSNLDQHQRAMHRTDEARILNSAIQRGWTLQDSQHGVTAQDFLNNLRQSTGTGPSRLTDNAHSSGYDTPSQLSYQSPFFQQDPGRTDVSRIPSEDFHPANSFSHNPYQAFYSESVGGSLSNTNSYDGYNIHSSVPSEGFFGSEYSSHPGEIHETQGHASPKNPQEFLLNCVTYPVLSYRDSTFTTLEYPVGGGDPNLPYAFIDKANDKAPLYFTKDRNDPYYSNTGHHLLITREGDVRLYTQQEAYTYHIGKQQERKQVTDSIRTELQSQPAGEYSSGFGPLPDAYPPGPFPSDRSLAGPSTIPNEQHIFNSGKAADTRKSARRADIRRADIMRRGKAGEELNEDELRIFNSKRAADTRKSAKMSDIMRRGKAGEELNEDELRIFNSRKETVARNNAIRADIMRRGKAGEELNEIGHRAFNSRRGSAT